LDHSSFVSTKKSKLKTTIMKTLHCADAGFDCKAVVEAETVEEILAHAAEHAQAVHGVAVTPEMAEQIKGLIKDKE
jgi:predicted small metal-binding protein